MNMIANLNTDITPDGPDYETVRQVIELITEDYRDQPSLETIAARLNQSPTQLQKTFTRWAGLSPKAFLQAVTLDHAKRLLRRKSCRCWKRRWKSVSPARAGCTTSSSPMRRCRRANGRRGAAG
jgi:AraC-like DNA-binding protein